MIHRALTHYLQSLDDYRSLAEFRDELRRFLAFSDNAAREHDITPAQAWTLARARWSPPTQESCIELTLSAQTVVARIGGVAYNAKCSRSLPNSTAFS